MKVFPKLIDAITHSESESNLAIFSKEIGLGGKRHFLVCSREQFWEAYRKLSVKKHYEIILPNKPCKLYFDLEFDIRYNKERDGKVMTAELIELVVKTLKELLGSEVDLSDIIDLDSSSEVKFSKHIIFRYILERMELFMALSFFKQYFNTMFFQKCSFSKCVFMDVESCRRFVDSISAVATPQQRILFTVLKKNDQQMLFIDNRVYAKNQNFRTDFHFKKFNEMFIKLNSA